MREAGAPSTEGIARKLQHTTHVVFLCLPTGDSHVRTARALKL
jgi:hypothetical protein